jgi:kynurenine formamidase
MQPRWKVRPPQSNWGEFGPDDQLGRLNLIDRAKVLQGIAEVREGLVFCLSLPLDRPGGNYHDLGRRPPKLEPLQRNGRPKYNLRPHATRPDLYCDDHVELYNQFSTHWDALSHVGSAFDADGDGVAEPRFYNGYRGGINIGGPSADDGAFGGARALGIDKMARACVQGRGVMIDLQGTFGTKRRIVGYDDLMRACEATGAEIEPGDMVCIHTGQAAALWDAGPEPGRELLEDAFCHLDGCDERLLRFIDESRMAVLIADNFAVEAVPPRQVSDDKAYEGLHELCLFKLGIHLGELWYLSELNRWLKDHGRTRFLLTAPPLALPGAVGSPVTPVATV